MNRKTLEEDEWEDFYTECQNKKIILFGVSEFMELFWEHDNKKNEIYAVIDNDVKKQNCYLGDLCAADTGKGEKIIIRSVEDVCRHIKADEVIVLICNYRYYKSMAEQLEQYNIKNYYIAHLMEHNWIKDHGSTVDRESKKSNYLNEYIQDHGLEYKCLVFVEKYGGHGIYISKSLHNLIPDIQIVWVVSDMHIHADGYVKKVSTTNWKKVIEEVETSRVVIYDNKILSTIYKKRKGQIFIQTKHWSSVTLKKFWLDDPQTMYPEQLEKLNALKDNTDYVFIGSEFDKKTCESGFGFKGTYVNVGSCRSDILFDRTQIDLLKNKYALSSETKYILYAPTARREIGNGFNRLILHSDLPDFALLLSSVKEKFGGEWELIVRLHPGLSYMSGRFCDKAFFHDFTSIQDGQEVVAISDIVVTDYSSIMFEPAFVDKPVFLYAPDRSDFLKRERGFWIDYNELPFPIADSDEELKDNIMNFDMDIYIERKNQFMECYGVHEDGHASERASDFILGLLK